MAATGSRPAGAAEAEVPEVVRQVDDVETLKALSDPLRLSIMRALMTDVRTAMTVKQLAHALEQPPTRLYRHIKVLEAAGLIRVASTRLVSGIQESRYQVAQLALRLSRELLVEPGNASEVARAFAATLDDFRGRLINDILAGRLGHEPKAATDAEPPGPMLVMVDKVVSRERAVEFRARLDALMEEFNRPDSVAEEDVPVNFLMMFWSPFDR